LIIIAGTITIDPDKVEAALAAVAPMMVATQAEEGCMEYVFSADPLLPGCLRVFEQWENEDALRAHFQSPHMAEFQSVMGGFGVTDASVQRYDGAIPVNLL